MKFIKCNLINVYKKKLKTQQNTDIMAGNTTLSLTPLDAGNEMVNHKLSNLTIAESDPKEAMRAFLYTHLPRASTEYTDCIPQELCMYMLESLEKHSKQTIEQAGGTTPLASPRQGAPKIPTAPTRARRTKAPALTMAPAPALTTAPAPARPISRALQDWLAGV